MSIRKKQVSEYAAAATGKIDAVVCVLGIEQISYSNSDTKRMYLEYLQHVDISEEIREKIRKSTEALKDENRYILIRYLFPNPQPVLKNKFLPCDQMARLPKGVDSCQTEKDVFWYELAGQWLKHN